MQAPPPILMADTDRPEGQATLAAKMGAMAGMVVPAARKVVKGVTGVGVVIKGVGEVTGVVGVELVAGDDLRK